MASKVRGIWAALVLLACLTACQTGDRPKATGLSTTPAATPSTSPEDVGLHSIPMPTRVSQRAENAMVVVNPSGDVAVIWLTRTRGSDEWDELLTVVPATGAARAYASEGNLQEVAGAPQGFVMVPGKSGAIVLGADGNVTELRQVATPTSPDRQGLVRPVSKTWYADPAALTWWPEAEADEGSDVVIDDHGRVWLVPAVYPASSGDEVVIPEWGRAEWWYIGEHDAAHSKSHAHRTHAFNSSVVVVGDRVALVSGAWIDQSRDDTRTWKVTRMDERWARYWQWFGTPSGSLFSAPPDDQRVFLRNRYESWTSFEEVSLPRGFTNLQAAGDLLWSVRSEYPRKNAQLPVEVVISDDDGETWRHVPLRDL